MAFSNVWDTTFPPDTQLANLLGQDIRNGVKVDVQQRMAAISGLDAAKPNFAGDAQPANWNGILFFATDTGKIYQFNNPAWTNITTFFPGLTFRLKNVTPVNVVAPNGAVPNFAQTLAIPAVTAGTIIRITSAARCIGSPTGKPVGIVDFTGPSTTNIGGDGGMQTNGSSFSIVQIWLFILTTALWFSWGTSSGNIPDTSGTTSATFDSGADNLTTGFTLKNGMVGTAGVNFGGSFQFDFLMAETL